MSTNQQGDFATKYNWWTKKEDKPSIDIKTKISYVMTQGELSEVIQVFRAFDYKTLLGAYEQIKNDTFALKSRRNSVIITLLQEKKNHKL